jgi:putative ABC transport system substrate-binding protein
MRELAEELVRLKVDVIIVPDSIYTEAAKRATSTIPIVFLGHADPVATGHATSLARPGGNITGLSIMLKEASVKSLELLKQAVPGLARIAVIFDPATPSHGPILKAVEAASPLLALQFNLWRYAARRSLTAPFWRSSRVVPTRFWSLRRRCSSPGHSLSPNSR